MLADFWLSLIKQPPAGDYWPLFLFDEFPSHVHPSSAVPRGYFAEDGEAWGWLRIWKW